MDKWYAVHCNEIFRWLEPNSLVGRMAMELEVKLAEMDENIDIIAAEVSNGAVFEAADYTALQEEHSLALHREKIFCELYSSIGYGMESHDLTYERAVTGGWDRTTRRIGANYYPVRGIQQNLLRLTDRVGLSYLVEPGLHFQGLDDSPA